MAQSPPPESRGLFESLTRLVANLVAAIYQRLDLLSADIERARAQVLSLLVLAVVAGFCLGVGVVLAMLLLAAVFWETHRLLALGLITGFFLALGAVLMGVAMHKSRARPRLFAASLAELAKDRQQLVAIEDDHEPEKSPLGRTT